MSEAKKIQFRFRANDHKILEAILNGKKKAETRAATPKFTKAKKGDIAVLVCGNTRIEKTIKSTEEFQSIADLLTGYRPQEIDPFIKSAGELEKKYYSYPNYREKIRKYGLVAFKFDKQTRK